MSTIKQIINPRASWFTELKKVILLLEQGKKVGLRLIPRGQFEKADQKGKTKLLKGMLGALLKNIKIPIYGNLHCHLHDDHQPSLCFDKVNNTLHCFGCMMPGKTIDIFDIISFIFGPYSFPEQKLKAIELLVEGGKELASAMRVNTKGKGTYSKMELPKTAQQSFAATSTSKIYIDVTEDNECLEFLTARSINMESVKKFKLKCWQYKGNSYLVIPCDDKFYTRRKYKTGMGNYPKYWNKGDVALFNGNCLVKADEGDIIFIVESALDAILLDQLGYHVIAINGAEHFKKLIDKEELIKKKNLLIVLMMDKDKAGIGATKKIWRECKGKGINVYPYLYDGVRDTVFPAQSKDIGEAFAKDPDATTKLVEELWYRLTKPSDFAFDLIGVEPLPSKDGNFLNPLNNFRSGSDVPSSELKNNKKPNS
ncbi:toprim domain-containing protein [Schinkia azotoformans]|uniref:toprim domain-containing protein n=1 Tax=Schinkia azotoformans TaxID=1454 RepID=UPI002DBEE7D9|nr:toprim domain-containing protein [Schinkia azotoformans]MEC1717798.1 toprim domain-containing protein [Schinkia azotoformans]MEC1743570.1 toprim domain-containing protein [Schinkia azotoformans]MEC1746556.1 toprim domain-containing protein [Schinkia azotoformans]MEC1757800.1 toprim domain-containing protein [Schinkia azotoformans]MEC1769305.1 toprim domain-containing protein [Schinkia azotoformans]